MTDIINELPEWSHDTPYQVRSIAIRDACQAVSSAKKQYIKTKEFQEVKFRSKKSKHESIYIPKSAIKEKSFYVESLGMEIKSFEPLPKAQYDARLVFDHGRYFLCIPMLRSQKQPENQRKGIVALDPGVRNFLTGYSDSSVFKIGENDFGRIHRLCFHLDKLMSKISKSKRKQKQRLIRAAARIRFRMKAFVKELHHKTAFWLCNNYSIILIPNFETSKMVSKLNSKTARAMLTWSHFRFREFLKTKAWEYNALVIEVNEAYTSKTCTHCGNVQNIGGKSVWECKSCRTIWDRDINGARGILLRALGDSPILRKLMFPQNAFENLC